MSSFERGDATGVLPPWAILQAVFPHGDSGTQLLIERQSLLLLSGRIQTIGKEKSIEFNIYFFPDAGKVQYILEMAADSKIETAANPS